MIAHEIRKTQTHRPLERPKKHMYTHTAQQHRPYLQMRFLVPRCIPASTVPDPHGMETRAFLMFSVQLCVMTNARVLFRTRDVPTSCVNILPRISINCSWAKTVLHPRRSSYFSSRRTHFYTWRLQCQSANRDSQGNNLFVNAKQGELNNTKPASSTGMHRTRMPPTLP